MGRVAIVCARPMKHWRPLDWTGLRMLKNAVILKNFATQFIKDENEEMQTCNLAFKGYQYKNNGILHMLDRNRRIKETPERFQSCKDVFDIVVSCEERVYDQILEDMESREKEHSHPVHIINIDIQDNHEEATIGAFIIKDIVLEITKCEDLDGEIDEILQEFESKTNRNIMHSVVFM